MWLTQTAVSAGCIFGAKHCTSATLFSPVLKLAQWAVFGRECRCHTSLLPHWKLEKRVCSSCSVWRNKLLCELWNLMRLLSYHFVYSGFPRLLLPIFSNPISPFTFNLLTSERSCRRLDLPITQLPANKMCNFWILPDLVSVQMVTRGSL